MKHSGPTSLAFFVVFVLVIPSRPLLAELPPPPRSDIGEKAFKLERPGYFTAEVSTYRGALRSFMLHNPQYNQAERQLPPVEPRPPDYKLASGPKDMVSTWDPPLYPFAVVFESLEGAPKIRRVLQSDPSHPVLEEDFLTAYYRDPLFTPVSYDEEHVTLVWPDPRQDKSTLFIERTWRIVRSQDSKEPHYTLETSVRLWNLGAQEVTSRLRFVISAWEPPPKHPSGTCGGMFSAPPDNLAVVCRVADTIHKKERKDLIGQEVQLGEAAQATFGGITSRYFLTALIVPEGTAAQCLGAGTSNGILAAVIRGEQFILRSGQRSCLPDFVEPVGDFEGRIKCATALRLLGLEGGWDAKRLSEAYASKIAEASQEEEKVALQNAKEALMPGRMKEFSLRAFLGPKDVDELKAAGSGLEDTIDFWVLGFLCKPMLWILRHSYEIIPSWGVAIVLLTLLVKLLTLWPTQSSMKAMRRMAELKPKIDEIRERYKDDKAKMNQAIMDLYKREKVNPLGGCLPMLLQMPIWIALYRTIYGAVDLYQAPLFLWIKDLSAPDPYFVLPLLLGVLMFIQQKMTPSTGDQTQARVMQWMMPIMFTAFMLFLPSGLVFYILVNTVLSIGHQWILRRPQKAKA